MKKNYGTRIISWVCVILMIVMLFPMSGFTGVNDDALEQTEVAGQVATEETPTENEVQTEPAEGETVSENVVPQLQESALMEIAENPVDGEDGEQQSEFLPLMGGLLGASAQYAIICELPEHVTDLKIYPVTEKIPGEREQSPQYEKNESPVTELSEGAMFAIDAIAAAGYTVSIDDVVFGDPEESLIASSDVLEDEKVYTMPAGIVTIQLSVTPNTNTRYSIDVYQMGLDGSYPEKESPTITLEATGTTDTLADGSGVDYTGFTLDSSKSPSVIISGDGTAVLSLYFSRDKHFLTIGKGDYSSDLTDSDEYKTVDLYYGQTYDLFTPSKKANHLENYALSGWSATSGNVEEAEDSWVFTMGTADATISPVYTEGYSVSGTLGTNGWYISDVVVTPLLSYYIKTTSVEWTNQPLTLTESSDISIGKAKKETIREIGQATSIAIDKVAPSVTQVEYDGDPLEEEASGLYVISDSSEAEITVSATDADSGIATINGIEAVDNAATLTLTTARNNITVVDKAGNSSSFVILLEANDTVAPVVSISLSGISGTDYFTYEGDNNTYFSGNIVVSITVNDDCFDGCVPSVSYSKDGSGAATITPVQVEGESNTWTATINAEANHSADGTYTVTASAIDRFGNPKEGASDNENATASINNLIIDTTAPVLSATINQNVITNAAITDTVTVTDSYLPANAQCQVEVKKDETVVDASKYGFLAGDANTWNLNIPETAGDGVYTYSFSITDKAGNQGTWSGSYSITLDTAIPTDVKITYDQNDNFIERIIKAVRYLITRDQPLEVTVSAKDALSGVDRFEVYVPGKAEPQYSGNAVLNSQSDEYSYTFTISGQNKNQLSVVAIDKAGNRSDTSAADSDNGNKGNYLIDTTAPILDDAKTTQPVGVYDTDLTFNFTVTDPETDGVYSGLVGVGYTLYKIYEPGTKTGTLAENKWQNQDSGKYQWKNGDEVLQTKDFSITIPAELNSNYVYVVIHATDSASNSVDFPVGPFIMDNTVPAVSLSFDNNTAVNEVFFKAARTATITVTDCNFDPTDAEKAVVNTEGSVQPWSASEQLDASGKKMWTCTVSYPGDADYTLTLSMTDKGGNTTDSTVKEAESTVGTVNTGSSVAPYAFTVDKTSPTDVTITYSEASFAEKLLGAIKYGVSMNASAKVTLSAKDNLSGVDFFDVFVPSQAEKKYSGSATKSEETGVFSYTFVIEAQYKNQLSVIATDMAGNCNALCTANSNNTNDGNVLLDTVEPSVKTSTQPDGQTKGSDISFTYTLEDPVSNGVYSSLGEVSYTLYQVYDPNTKAGTLADRKWQNQVNGGYTWSAGDYVQTKDFVITIPAELNSNYVYVVIHAKDTAGNVMDDVAIGPFIMDDTVPAVTLSFDNNTVSNSPYFKNARTATITVTDRNFEPGITENVLIDTAGTKGIWQSTEELDDRGQKTWTITVSYPGDADYTLALSMTDKGGNKTDSTVKTGESKIGTVDTGASVAPYAFTVDKASPADLKITYREATFVEKLLGNIKYGVSMNDAAMVTLWAKDAPAGVWYFDVDLNEEAKVALTDNNDNIIGKHYIELDVDEDAEGWYSTEFMIDAQYVAQLSVSATDRADNTSQSIGGQSDVENVDNGNALLDVTAPKVLSTTTPNGVVNGQNIVFSFSLEDPSVYGVYSGLGEVSYTLYRIYSTEELADATWQDQATGVYLWKQPEYIQIKDDFSITIPAELNSNDVYVVIHATDNAGNKMDDYVVGPFMMDDTDPSVSAVFSGVAVNGSYFNTTRTAQLTVVDRNFTADCVAINTQGSVSGWTASEADASGLRTWTATASFTSDGDYTYSMSAWDIAQPQNTTGDGNVAYSGQACQSFTIDMTDPTFAITFSDVNGDAIEDGGYNNNETTITFAVTEHNFDSSSATSGIVVKKDGVDISSNVRSSIRWSTSGDVHTATYVIPEDGVYAANMSFVDMAANSSATAEDKTVTVDTVAPEIMIKGVEDDSANNDEIISPEITATDINYNPKGVIITVKGANKGKATYQTTDVEDGQKFIFDNIVQDDIYTISIEVTDKADNKTEQEITFSVNRNGATFMLDEDTQKFIDKYYNLNSADLVIIVYDIDDFASVLTLNSNGLDIRDLVEGKDYDVETEQLVGGVRRTYTIHGNVVEADGAYTVTITTTDEAGNVTTNADEDGSAYAFVIDSTSPAVTVYELTNGGIYNAEVKTVRFLVTDENLSSIRVDVNGTTVLKAEGEELDPNEYDGVFELKSSTDRQNVTIVCEDAVGNQNAEIKYILNADEEGKIKEGILDGQSITKVLVTTSFFARFYAHKAIFWSVVGLVVCGIGLGTWLVVSGKSSKNRKHIKKATVK